MRTNAILSEDRKYRYVLLREWDSQLPKIMFIGLNPSTADENQDDPTIRRCIAFAKSFDYGGFYMLNLFAYRSTSPSKLREVDDPIGEDNDNFLLDYISKVDQVVACWGNHGSYKGRSLEIRNKLSALFCFGANKTGEPKHPLYVKSDVKLKEYH